MERESKATSFGIGKEVLPVIEFKLPNADSHSIYMTWGPDGNLWLTEDLGNGIGRRNWFPFFCVVNLSVSIIRS